MAQKALFIGDESVVRQTTEILSQHLNDIYSVQGTTCCDEAIGLLKTQRFDVVIADISDPKTNGLRFLSQVVFHQPGCPRVIISSYEDRLTIASCLFVGHRYFNHPCDLKALIELLIRLASFRNIVWNDKIRRIIGGLGSLPGPPQTFLKLEKILAARTASLDEIAAIVEQDPVLTAKLLQIVNSASFGMPRQLNVLGAVQILGLATVRILAIGLHTFTAYDSRRSKGSAPSGFWDHSLNVATDARRIARAQGFSSLSSERAFLAGLLHDIGRIVVHANSPQETAEVEELVKRCEIPSYIAESQRFAVTYADIGAYLLTLWGIDDEIAAIVQCQDRVDQFRGSDFGALAAMHVAHTIHSDPVAYPLQTESLRELGFADAAQWAAEIQDATATH